jgi:hypothetical protein
MQQIHFEEAAWKLRKLTQQQEVAEEAEEAAHAESACGKVHSLLWSTLPRCFLCYVDNQMHAPGGTALLCTPTGSCRKLSWHGDCESLSPALRVCAAPPAQLSELLLRIFTADVLQQRLCLCGVVTLLTQHLLTSPCALYKAC